MPNNRWQPRTLRREFIPGPTGPAGSNGATGATGAQGPTGPAGAAGSAGALGSPGVDGVLPFATTTPNVVNWRFATADDVKPGFTPTLALHSGPTTAEVGQTFTPTYDVTPAPNAAGITNPRFNDNQGHTNVPIVGGNPVSAPVAYNLAVPGTVSATVTEVSPAGVEKTTNPVNTPVDDRVYFGVGGAGATGLTVSVNDADLVGAAGTLTGQLVSSVVNSTATVRPNNQKVYCSCRHTTTAHTFVDTVNGFGFPMTRTVSAFSYTNKYGLVISEDLYESVNLLGDGLTDIKPKVAT